MGIRLGEAFWGKDTGMQLIDQLLNFIRQGLSAVFRFIELVWRWSVEQILSVPWGALGDLPLWKQLLLVIVAAAVIYLLYRAIRELLDAGEKALVAIATLLTVMIKTLPPAILAGLAAAAGAYVINNVNF
jgi:phage-related protein